MEESMECIDNYKNNFIRINQEDFPVFCSLIERMAYIRININLEIMKYELAEKIFNETEFKLDLFKHTLYLNRFDKLNDGFIKVIESFEKYSLYLGLIRLHEICREYKEIIPDEFNAGRFINIEAKFL